MASSPPSADPNRSRQDDLKVEKQRGDQAIRATDPGVHLHAGIQDAQPPYHFNRLPTEL